MLFRSYVRRKQFESRMLAGEVLTILAGTPTDTDTGSAHQQPRTTARQTHGSTKIPPGKLLGLMGVEIEGLDGPDLSGGEET